MASAGDAILANFEVSGVACMTGRNRPCTAADFGTRTAIYVFRGVGSNAGIRIDGQDIGRIPPRATARSVAAVLQEQPSSLGLSVREVVASGRTPHRSGFATSSARDSEVVDAVLGKVDLHSLAHRDLTIVVSLHDLNIAAQMCDAIVLLENGHTVGFSPPETVLSEAAVSATFRIDAHREQLTPARPNNSHSICLTEGHIS